MKDCSSTPVLGFIAFSGTGKTTLLEQVIPLLRERGLEVALIKHAHHDFDIDIPGKDSYRLRKAGAAQTLIASRKRWALITEHAELPEPNLNTLLRELDHDRLDLILVEGFKHENFPKIELRRESLNKPRLYPEDEAILAVATDRPEALTPTRTLSVLDLNRVEAIAEFIQQWVVS